MTAGGFLLAIAGLYFGREFFIPFSLAVLLAFALSPIVSRLKRWRVPRVAAVLLAVTLAFSVIGGLSYVVATQLVSLADAVPNYRMTMIEKVRSLRASSATEGGIVERVTDTIEGVKKELSAEEPANGRGKTAADSLEKPKPIPVTLAAGERSPLDVLAAVLGPLVEAFATAGIVIVFVIFVLLEKEELRDRFIKLVGAGDLHTSTQAISEAGMRVSRYLLAQLVVNVTYGLPIGVGLYFIGIPNAVLWGLLAAVLRFIPYLGPFLAALFPLVLAFIVDPGWSMLLWVIGLFVAMELISNNVVEPWLYGASTGLSSLAIVSAAIFWTSLWGPIGLILATPLTVCLTVVGRYVPQLQFLGVLLSSDPVLKPEEQMYQRLLSGNAEGAIELAENYTDEHSAEAFYDEVAIPALRLAENDQLSGPAEREYRRAIADGMSAVVREVAEHLQQKRNAEARKGSPDEHARLDGPPKLCVAGRTDLDAVAAQMVADHVAQLGIAARMLPPIAISQNGIGQIDLAGVEVVCLSYLANEPQAFARYACRRLKRRAPDIKVVVCLWNLSPALPAGDLKEKISADAVVSSVEAAAALIDTWMSPTGSEAARTEPTEETTRERIAALRELGLVAAEGRYFDEVAAKTAAAFGTPISLVTVLDDEHQHWPGAVGLPAELDEHRADARDASICAHVVALNDVLVVEDVAQDLRFTDDPFLIENDIRFYAGAPLRTSSGFTIGALCVIDTEPRSFSDEDRETLRNIADGLMVRVELAHHRERHQDRGAAAEGSAGEEMPESIRRALTRLEQQSAEPVDAATVVLETQTAG